jgi:putative ABC transport system permease protein
MFASYLKVALRAMLKRKGYTLINIVGLTVSIAVCFLIFLWVKDELSYDRFNTKAERTYRVSWKARFGNNEWDIPLIPVPVAETLEKQFPEVERTVRLRQGGFSLRFGNDFVREEKALFVEDSFFEVFTVHFVSGSPADALRDPDAIILTTQTAQRYFPNQNPIGETLERNDGKLLRVTAVVDGFPAQSHMHFDFLAPLKSLPIVERRKDQWGSATVYTYVVLKEGQDVHALEGKFQQYVDKNVAGDALRQSGNYTSFPMTPLLDIHLRSHLQYELEPNGDITYVYLFSIIAVFVLLLACINFVNLATARAMKRAREVAIRKVLGSRRTQLVRQFLVESFAHVFLAIFGAIAVAELVLPAFNELSGKQITVGFFDSPFALATLAGLAVAVTLLAGAYPAFFLSSFRPASALKTAQPSSMGRDRLRKVLVVLQFCISISLVVGTMVVFSQLRYIQNKRLGFDKEHVLVIHRASALGTHFVAFRERLRREAAVVDASGVQFLPGQIFDSTVFALEQPANYQTTSISYDLIDEHTIATLGMKIVAGRSFSPSIVSDSSSFLINQTAAEAFGWKDPIGKHVSMGESYKGPIIGVVQDFNFQSLRHEVKPLILLLNRWSPSNLVVRLRPGNTVQAVEWVRALWKEALPNVPFEFSFLDDDYQKLYRNEERVASVFSTFTLLAIIIACLGLFGLASFTTEQRTKEIGIRKVLGATEVGIVGLLTKEFAQLVLIAAVIAIPISYLAIDRWLQGFAYRTELGWWTFALAGGMALAIAILTVSYQAVRAALANPVEALRYE